jgi:hypothetical protein
MTGGGHRSTPTKRGVEVRLSVTPRRSRRKSATETWPGLVCQPHGIHGDEIVRRRRDVRGRTDFPTFPDCDGKERLERQAT